MSHLPYNKSSRKNARKNRKMPTKREGLVRHMILKHRPGSTKRTRQKPLGNYIVDFYCASLRLVLELDGSHHNYTYDYDEKRTTYLHKLGIKVIRYTNTQVEKELRAVADDIVREIEERKEQLNTKNN